MGLVVAAGDLVHEHAEAVLRSDGASEVSVLQRAPDGDAAHISFAEARVDARVSVAELYFPSRCMSSPARLVSQPTNSSHVYANAGTVSSLILWDIHTWRLGSSSVRARVSACVAALLLNIGASCRRYGVRCSRAGRRAHQPLAVHNVLKHHTARLRQGKRAAGGVDGCSRGLRRGKTPRAQ
jgi:hypothetical protein